MHRKKQPQALLSNKSLPFLEHLQEVLFVLFPSSPAVDGFRQPSRIRIIEGMARGWESKSVEEQQAEASQRKLPSRSKITPQEARILKQMEGLRLSRQRVLQQLDSTHYPRHRQMLEHALADLDRQIEALHAQ
jgi:hypothetical protein